MKGLEGLCAKLKVDLKKGLTPADLPERALHFGHNRNELPVAEGFWSKFIGALDEFMLQVLLAAGAFSIIVDMLTADKKDRKIGKQKFDIFPLLRSEVCAHLCKV